MCRWSCGMLAALVKRCAPFASPNMQTMPMAVREVSHRKRTPTVEHAGSATLLLFHFGNLQTVPRGPIVRNACRCGAAWA